MINPVAPRITYSLTISAYSFVFGLRPKQEKKQNKNEAPIPTNPPLKELPPLPPKQPKQRNPQVLATALLIQNHLRKQQHV